MFCFPNSDHVMFPREFAFYLYTGTWIDLHRTKFEARKLKTPIATELEPIS